MPPVPVESVLNPEPHHQTAPTAISSNRDHSIIRKITKKKQAAAVAATRRREPQAVTKICFKSATSKEVPFSNQGSCNNGKMVKLDRDAIKAIVEAGGGCSNGTAPPPPLPSSAAPLDPTPAAPPTTPLLSRAAPSDGGGGGGVHPVTNGSSEAEHDEDVNKVDSAANRLVNGHADAFPELEGGDVRLSINGVNNHCDNNGVVDVGNGESHESNNVDIAGNGENHGSNNVNIVGNGENHESNNVDIVCNGGNHESNNVNIVCNGENHKSNNVDVVGNGENHESNNVDIIGKGENHEPNNVDIIGKRESHESNDVNVLGTGKNHELNNGNIVGNTENPESNNVDIVGNRGSHESNDVDHADISSDDILPPMPGGQSGETTLCLARLGGERAPEGGEAEFRESHATTVVVADALVDGEEPGVECASPPLCLSAPPTPAVQITNITILVNGVDIDTFESGGAIELIDNDVVDVTAKRVEDDDDDDIEFDEEQFKPLPPVPPTRASSNLVLKSYEEKLESRNRKSNKWQHPKSYHRYPKTRKAAKLEDVEAADLLEDDEAENGEIPTPTLDAGGKVTEEFLLQLVRFFKHQRRLPSMTVRKILQEAKEHFVTQPSLVDIELGRDDVINICGDIHGQFYDLARILDMFGRPSKSNRYLFNGDFVDRGPWSVEVVLTLLSHKLLYSDQFHLNRGNHETEEINKMYGFYSEVIDKYDAQMFTHFQEVFSWLPVAHCVSGSVLVMHGGLSRTDGVTLEDIRSIERGGQPDRDDLMCDLLWSDPQDEPGRFPNSRGFSCLFGPDVTSKFLADNKLLYIVRSHECVQYGYDLTHDDQVVTVFSAPNYCDRHGNKGAVCVLHGDDVSMPEFKKFEAAPHPKVDPMKYASTLMRLGVIG